MSARLGKAVPTRRSHQKSRTGCYTCKKRHVKCDEGRPACENCSRRGMSCSFPLPEQQLSRSTSPAEQTQQSFPSMLHTDVGQPSNSLMSIPIHSNAPSTSCPSPTSTTCSRTLQFSIKDMSLLYYYTAYTSATFADLPEIVEIYKSVAPEVAFSDSSLLYCLLAIAALHRAHVEPAPEQQKEYFSQATEYQNRSIVILRDRIANITQEDCVGTFFSSSILSVYTLAAESWLWQRSRDIPSIARVDDMVRCLRLLRGVPSILKHKNNAVFDWVMEGPLRPIGNVFLQKPKGHFNPEQESHFAALHQFLAKDQDTGEEERHVYLEALRVLREYAELLLDRQVQQQIETVGLTLTWPVIVSERYLAYLEAHRRGAFLLLAQYAILFDRLREFWWANAWSYTLLTVTLELLPDVWKCSILQFHNSLDT